MGAKHTATPWEADTLETRDDFGHYSSYQITDQNGRTICDFTNSDTAEIHECPYDDDENGPGVDRWDNQARADAHFIVAAVNAHDALAEIAQVLVDRRELDAGAFSAKYPDYPMGDVFGALGWLTGRAAAALAKVQS
jgi:hypothetical protein